MSYKVLYRKYRPEKFDDVVGQEYTIKMLKNAISNGKSSHAYLFTGPRGTGKTSSAKIFAKALNCESLIDGNPCNSCKSCLSFNESPDIIELDAASNNSVEDIREIIDNVKLVPSELKRKIYIIDEVHMLSQGAFNALLLTLEEPPEHVVFILATTEIQKVPLTILSRCQRFDFKPIYKEAMISRLKYIAKEEDINISDSALEEIATISAGGMRDALGILDQLSSSNDEIDLDLVTNNFGSISNERIESIISYIDDNNLDDFIDVMNNIKLSGTNYSVFLEKIIIVLREKAIQIKLGNSLNRLYYEDIYNMIMDLNEIMTKASIYVNPYILIEMTLLKYFKKDELSTANKLKNSVDYFPGNNLKEEVEEKKYFPGNNLDEKKEVKSSTKNKVETSLGNNLDVLGNNFEIANEVPFDLGIRINNCFCEAAKDIKKNVSEKWVEFMNFLMTIDRNLVSLLADTVVLAASKRYVLIQSKSKSTNDLINREIEKIEKNFEDFSGNKIRFAAVDDDLWKKEVEKYRINLKNKIKYSYIEEEVLSTASDDVDLSSTDDDIELIAKDIFDSYEIVE